MMRKKLIFLLIFGLSTACFAKGVGDVTFPNNVEGSQSPDKHFLIFSEDHEGQEPAHSLRLKDESSGQSRKILDYGRHVDVAWSPSSLAFYVNDYSGSDATNCLIVIPTTSEEVDLSALIKAQNGEKSALWLSHHKYITCKSWVKNKVIVSFAGYGDAKPDGFELRYKFDLNSKKLRRLVKRQ